MAWFFFFQLHVCILATSHLSLPPFLPSSLPPFLPSSLLPSLPSFLPSIQPPFFNLYWLNIHQLGFTCSRYKTSRKTVICCRIFRLEGSREKKRYNVHLKVVKLWRHHVHVLIMYFSQLHVLYVSLYRCVFMYLSFTDVFPSLFQLSNTFGGAWGEERSNVDSPSAAGWFYFWFVRHNILSHFFFF